MKLTLGDLTVRLRTINSRLGDAKILYRLERAHSNSQHVIELYEGKEFRQSNMFQGDLSQVCKWLDGFESCLKLLEIRLIGKQYHHMTDEARQLRQKFYNELATDPSGKPYDFGRFQILDNAIVFWYVQEFDLRPFMEQTHKHMTDQLIQGIPGYTPAEVWENLVNYLEEMDSCDSDLDSPEKLMATFKKYFPEVYDEK